MMGTAPSSANSSVHWFEILASEAQRLRARGEDPPLVVTDLQTRYRLTLGLRDMVITFCNQFEVHLPQWEGVPVPDLE